MAARSDKNDFIWYMQFKYGYHGQTTTERHVCFLFCFTLSWADMWHSVALVSIGWDIRKVTMWHFVCYCQGLSPNFGIAKQLQHELLQRSCTSSSMMPAMHHVIPASPTYNLNMIDYLEKKSISLQIIQCSAQDRDKLFPPSMSDTIC